jgi:phosphate transport system substrate-binding protein
VDWHSPKRALVIAVVSTLVGCSAHTPPTTTPGTRDAPLRVMVTSSALPLVIDAVSAYPDPQFNIEVRTSDYRQSVAALRRGDAHLVFTSHLAPEDVRQLWAAPIVNDAIALITHPETPIENLSIDQLRQAYQGRVTDWSMFGASNYPLLVVSREDGSGIRAEFEQAVMGSRRTTGAALTAASNEGVLRLVRETPGALGYISLASLETGVRLLAVEGVLPSMVTLADQTYPLRSTVFAAAITEPTGIARDFIGWLQGPSGQDALKRRYQPVLATPTP